MRENRGVQQLVQPRVVWWERGFGFMKFFRKYQEKKLVYRFLKLI